MTDFSQRLINGLDKTSVDGFAEALLIAIGVVKNKDGLLVRVTLSDDFEEHIAYARQIATMMLREEKYTRPPSAWADLTDEEIDNMYLAMLNDKREFDGPRDSLIAIARAVEAKLREKNT